MKSLLLSVVIVLASLGSIAQTNSVNIATNECWWGVANYFGMQMPFTDKTDLCIDLKKSNYSNQCASFLVSDQGRVIWTESQAVFTIRSGVITIDSPTEIFVEQGGTSLAEGYTYAMLKWFPACGDMPDPLFFSAPQLNTWIELTYHQNQKDVLKYAQTMLEHKVPPGVLMIDDTWQAGYGDWRFEPERFENPKAMIDQLHSWGYKVMLWMCPYVGMDLPAFRRIAWGINPDDYKGYPTKGGFLAIKGSKPELNGRCEAKPCLWWNGISAFLDFSHPNANAWFSETLDGLVNKYGVDGFKLDGADLSAYNLDECDALDPQATNGSLNNGFAGYALKYRFSEIRNLWRMQQLPVVVRLHDKQHNWEALQRVVADMISAGLIGQPFICPDMVGGGEWITFIPGSPFDPELFIRSAQIHALCPMMQFSASPWRVLNSEHQKIIQEVVALRQRFAPQIVKLAEEAASTGEPILRNMEYNYPHQGYAHIRDQFMMGKELIVAPQMTKGAQAREVTIPPGRWVADDGIIVKGPTKIFVETPLSRLPYFRLSE